MSLSKLSNQVVLVFACAAFLAVTAHAQFRAGIQGTVTDSSGAIVKGAKITVTNQETGASQDAIADDAGFYSVGHLGPGLYTVSASMAGFKVKVIKDIRINAEDTSGVNVVLDPGAVTEEVTVNGDTLPTLQTEDASISGTITSDQSVFRLKRRERVPVNSNLFRHGSRVEDHVYATRILGIDPDVLDHLDLETSHRSTNGVQPRSKMANTVESGIVRNGILRRAGLLIRYGNLGVLYDRPGRIRHCPLNTRAKLRVCGHSQKRCAGK